MKVRIIKSQLSYYFLSNFKKKLTMFTDTFNPKIKTKTFERIKYIKKNPKK